VTHAVVAEGLGKTYRLHRERRRTLKEVVLRQYAPADDVEALRDVSFTVDAGKAFGVIGANGSGKSTLLKLLAGTSKPTAGRLDVRGRISALLEIGAGFHPDFTGRENAYLNGALLGLSRKRMTEVMPQIEAFADIGKFFDAPVKTYSSGMYMRLGFSVSVHVEPDVLLVDEVLAVGDEYFQHKCFAKIEEFRKSERTILLVSHDLNAVARLCERALWLADGRVAGLGPTRDVINAYHRTVGEKEMRERKSRGEVGQRFGSGEIRMTGAKMVGADGSEAGVLDSGQAAAIEIAYENPQGIADAAFGVQLYRDDGIGVYGTNTLIDGFAVPVRERGVVRFVVDELELLPGAYDADIGITDGQDRVYDYHAKGLSFRVIGTSRELGIARQRHRWEVR
jgi:ABC-type polysaccharide/polyol phosphate transport system ATPase subunit